MSCLVDDFSFVNERIVDFGWSEYHSAFVVSASCKTTGLIREVFKSKGRSRYDRKARYVMDSWLSLHGTVRR